MLARAHTFTIEGLHTRHVTVEVDGGPILDQTAVRIEPADTLESLAEPFLRSGQLVRVLEDWSPAFKGLFLYYPGQRQVPAALRAFCPAP